MEGQNQNDAWKKINYLPVYSFFLIIFKTMTTPKDRTARLQPFDFSKIKSFEHQLGDVMELANNIQLKLKLKEVEEDYKQNPTEINKARLGIVYHETAWNLSFLSKTKFKGYAKRSFDILNELLLNLSNTSRELLPFITAYRGSALSLVAAETKNLKLITEAFILLNDAVDNYAAFSYAPEFLRGSVAENLPWSFFSKRKFAKLDFQSIIEKQEENCDFANWKIMSFTYWAWANQRQGIKNRSQALSYLDKAIELDPDNKAGRSKAEDLKVKLLRKN